MAKLLIRVDKTGPRKAVQRHIVAVAKRHHADIMTAAPKPTGFLRVVDGVQGAPEETVKVGGRIVYYYDRLDKIVQASLALLMEISPVLEGKYRDAHFIAINGQPVADLSSYSPGDDVSITNYQPYARVIEAGAMKMRVPGTDHIYQQARQLLMRRYGNQVSIEFTFRDGPNEGSKSNLRFPCLVFRPAGTVIGRRKRR